MKEDLNAMICATMESLKSAGAVDNAIGAPIHLSDGSVLIPMSKISIGFATGGGDYTQRQRTPMPIQFAGGGGGGVTITPIGFLCCGPGEEPGVFKMDKEERKELFEKLLSVAAGVLKR